MMPTPPLRGALTLCLLAAFATLGPACDGLDPQFGDLAAPPSPPESDAGAVSFARDIRPLLDRAEDDPAGPGCKKCHYSTEPMHVGYDLGGLDLATLGSLRKGGATAGAKIVIAGAPEDSVLVQKLEGTYGYGARMPRSGPPYLRSEEIKLVKAWILAGAEGQDSE